MDRVIKLGLMLTFSLATLSGCGSVPTSTESNVYSVSGDATVTNASATQKMKGGKGMQGQGKGQRGQGGGFGLPAELNLTDEQKTQLAALRPQAPAQNDDARTKMEAVRKAINDAFVSDTFDVNSLKAQLEAARPAQTADRFTAEATRIVSTYNILTAEQRTILETKQAEMASKTPQVRPTPSAEDMATHQEERLTKLATDLGLTDAQKASLKEVMQPPAASSLPSREEMDAKRKATHDAINAELKTGNATVESIAAILKANAPTDVKSHGDELDRLAKIHDILNADQRAKFIANNKGLGGPEGGRGGHGHGGPGGHGGFGQPGQAPDGEAAPPQE